MRDCSSIGSSGCAISIIAMTTPSFCARPRVTSPSVMSFAEDLIRVAQAKIDPARMQRIAAGTGREERELSYSALPNF